MKRLPALLLACFVFSLVAFAAPRTLRIDYYHTGNSQAEVFSLDRVVLEPLEWPGNPNKSIDESGLGNYLFEVREQGNAKHDPGEDL